MQILPLDKRTNVQKKKNKKKKDRPIPELNQQFIFTKDQASASAQSRIKIALYVPEVHHSST